MLVREREREGTSDNEVHLRKAAFPMAVTESGMVMLVNALHPEKA